MALVRLKRSLDEDPVETLLIAYKKRKEDTNQTSIFKFATTLDKKEDVCQHYSKVINLVDLKKLYKHKQITNITEKLRKENKLYSQNNRLKLVNCLRESLEDKSNDAEGFLKNEVTLLEVESSCVEKLNQPNISTESASNNEANSYVVTQFVYDIYYAPNILNDIDLTAGHEISCHVIDSEMAFESYRDDAYTDEVEEDEDDSNDENNWRNDYPDEEDDSIGEDDMKFAAHCSGLTLGDNNSDVSSEEDENIINSIDISSNDVAMYGEGYAKYKKRIQKQDLSDDDEFDGVDYYDYKDYISSSDSEKSAL